jgi:hypothetical protein
MVLVSALLPHNPLIYRTDASVYRPGAAGIGLMAGQIGVGLGSAVGHASAVNRVLSSANLQLFLPKGLEIW